jgi:acyl carrier protein
MSAQQQPRAEPTPTDAVEIQERIMQMIRTRLHIDIEDPTEELFETQIIDSLGLVELLVGLEEEFGVPPIIGEDFDIENFRSVLSISYFLLPRIPATDNP